MREREQLEAEERQRSPEVKGERQAVGSTQDSRAVMGSQSPKENGGLSQR